METPLRLLPPVGLPSEFSGFKTLPAFLSTEFQGILPPRIYHYRLQEESGPRDLFCHWMVLKEDSLAWTAFLELWDPTMRLAASQMQVFFGMELLSLDLAEGLSGFQPGNLAQLIVNHAKRLEPGSPILIRYASLWMVLTKRTYGDWGRIDFKSRVELVSKPEHLDLSLKKMMRETAACSQASRSPRFALFDLGQSPVFKFGAEEQTGRIHRWFEGLQKKSEPIPEIYVCHRGKCIELAAQFGFRDV